ncbi:MAG: 4-(cytidine 5'-diphospho)-2-C-methyl-D-erythritol kinase [Bacteroidetes bacterium]|nr:4-(cytidine 5'-diphospho)-2-C-methyl-D-erythritol kinase [Bacteroidota bacterium]
MKLIINSPAKINFGLFITQKRADGFHNIETIFYPLELCDQIIMRECDHLLIETDSPDLNIDIENNLIFKAVKLMESKTGRQLNCRISLEKRIPMGAGLGGGSSNAASVLLGLNDLFDLKYTKEDLRGFGAELGSDVPFFIHPVPSFGSGRGEILTPLDFELAGVMVVVNPGIHVATGPAYKNCKPGKAPFNLLELNQQKSYDYNKLQQMIKNAFEETVFIDHPEIGGLKELFYKESAEFALMSGSGSTVFGIFDSIKKAEEFAKTLPQNYFVYFEEL